MEHHLPHKDVLPLPIHIEYWRNVLRSNHVQTHDQHKDSLIIEMRSALMNALDALEQERRMRLQLEQHLQALMQNMQEQTSMVGTSEELAAPSPFSKIDRLVKHGVI